jgi:hypothetical protein
MKKWFEANAECPTGCGCRCGDLGFQEEGEDEEEEDSAGGHRKKSKKLSRGPSPATSTRTLGTVSNDTVDTGSGEDDDDDDEDDSEENSDEEEDDDEPRRF